METPIEKLGTLSDDELLLQIREDAGYIVDRTPLGDDESWDDPEEILMPGVRLAHAVKELFGELPKGV